jgi:outer membrane protein assembly factor BamE (lipoprotein component of BamABCDE complex)
MTFRPRSRLLLAIAFAGVLAAGCTPFREHQGYLLDYSLVDSIQPGVDNRESVQGTLGRPTFTGQFANADRDWYYVSRDTGALAFRMPRPTAQTVIHVRFDATGNVEAVNRTGLELVSNIRPERDKTPTLGRHRSLFEELFGNIGAVGQAGDRGQTADNPQ